MKKTLLVLLGLLSFFTASYLVYLNEVVLPEKIKSALVTGLEKSTGKRVAITSAKIDLIRGLVIKGLIISDDGASIIASEDVSCRFLIMPVFKNQIVVTSIKFESPQILVKRQPDNTINIVELLFKGPILLMDGKFTLTISKIIVSHGRVNFIDQTFEEPFLKDFANVNATLRLSLPDKVIFTADFEIPSEVTALVRSSGEYACIAKELSAHIEAKDLYPKEFTKYCDPEKFIIPDGRIDASVSFIIADNKFDADAQISGMDLKFSDGPPVDQTAAIEARLSCAVKAKIKYDITSKELIYTGSAAVNNLELYNLDIVDKIYDIRGNASFSDKTFSLEDITATVLGLPVKANARIEDLQKPSLKIDAVSEVKLEVLRDILKSKFKIEIPLEMKGNGILKLNLLYKGLTDIQPAVDGSLETEHAIFKSEYSGLPAEDVCGRFDFTQNQLSFKGLKLRYNKIDYLLSGTVTNFQKPGVQLDVDSPHLSFKSLGSLNDKTIILSSVAGRFNDYIFSMQGNLDISEPKDPKADISGSLAFELSEQKEPYKSLKEKLKDLKLSGSVKFNFSLNGKLKDISKSMIEGNINSQKLSVNNYKFINFDSHFTYRSGISNIEYIRAKFYGGTLEGNGLIDFASKDNPYQLNAQIKGVKIEDIKHETPLKDKDVSGIINTKFGVKGFFSDQSRFSAWGKAGISKGRLWQVNLFRGIGTLLFRSDFNSVLFEEGSCSFFIKDKSFFTNDLVMKSSLLELYGAIKISFDKTLNASLKAAFTDEGIDAARTSGIAGAIERYAVIEVKGTLDEPTYKLRPDLSNIANDFAEGFLSQ